MENVLNEGAATVAIFMSRSAIVDRDAPKVDSESGPRTWDEYVGQADVKEALSIAAKSSRARGDRIPHVLLVDSQASRDKVSLALLTAKERDPNITVRRLAKSLKVDQARILFSLLQDHDVLLLDGCNELLKSRSAQFAWLRQYLTTGTIDGPHGPEQQRSVTIIGIASELPRAAQATADSFQLQLTLADYTPEEAVEVCKALAFDILNEHGLPTLEPWIVASIVEAAKTDIELSRENLVRLRDFALAGSINFTEDGYDATQVAKLLGLRIQNPDAVASVIDLDLPTPRLVKGADAAEDYAAEVLRALGYADARRTPKGVDGGIDVVADGLVAQVKFEGLPTGRPAVQAIYGIAQLERAAAVFFSLAGYTPQALDWADRAQVACLEFEADGTIAGANSAGRRLLNGPRV